MKSKTIAFLGASGGVGLSALTASLAAGHNCVALCRKPSKLTDRFPTKDFPNLEIIEGNAHDDESVLKLVRKDADSLVDQIITTIGGAFDTKRFTIDDLEVCRKGMSTLINAIKTARSQGLTGRPRIVVCSTTGISKFGRDIPLLMVPLYHVLLKDPHVDKEIMEATICDSGEDFTVVRPSLLTTGASNNPVRVGIEDPKTGRESSAIGYTISREDAGTWIAEQLILKEDNAYLNKMVMITY